jgi:serine-type D-Ala-D-Ala carboxypeptidase/endopeptidase (penicillin-binding protein 4)
MRDFHGAAAFRTLVGPMRRRIAAPLALLALLAAAPTAGATGLAGTQRALARQMALAGASSGALVVDLTTGRQLYARRPGIPRMPASVEKLYTSATALLRFGPGATLNTSVLASVAPDPDGTLVGDVYLRGGGDPTFSDTGEAAIATALRAQGLTRVTGAVVGDESFFDAFRGPPSSGLATSIDVGPLSGLAFDHGLTGKRFPLFQPQPARFAAQAFKRALGRAGIKVAGSARAGVAPFGAAPLLQWPSPPMADVLRLMNQPSDNYMAETLIKALGASFGTAGSTAAGAAIVRTTISRMGVRPRLVDGSGLSRLDRTSPRQVVRLLQAMTLRPSAPAFTASLPVAGVSGTLALRMRRTAASGRCAAKTGTLHDVSALAGYCSTLSGERLAFAILMNRVTPLRARVLQDRMTTALARYEPDQAVTARR